MFFQAKNLHNSSNPEKQIEQYNQKSLENKNKKINQTKNQNENQNENQKNNKKNNRQQNKRSISIQSDQLLNELKENQSIELLKELHILTRDGQLNQDSRRKLKQVYHLFEFIQNCLDDLSNKNIKNSNYFNELDKKDDNIKNTKFYLTLADHGAGKSYLGFILYDLYFKKINHGHIYGIENRAELVEKSRDLAQRLGFSRMSFIHSTVEQSQFDAQLPQTIDVVTALHACDTATDDAINFGLSKKASYMVLVPCCQAEIASVLRQKKALFLTQTPLAELWRHPLHTRELGSQLTNVLRCLYLEACGYQVTVTELIGWEHSMKNELILARFTGQKKHLAKERLSILLDQFGLSEMLQTRFSKLAVE